MTQLVGFSVVNHGRGRAHAGCEPVLWPVGRPSSWTRIGDDETAVVAARASNLVTARADLQGDWWVRWFDVPRICCAAAFPGPGYRLDYGLQSMKSNVLPNPSEHAIVIGGGIAGLLSAHVLSRHFRRVTLFDRDRFPATPQTRPGIPQAHHVHVLLTRGYKILRELLPGFDAHLRQMGAPLMDWAQDVDWFIGGGWTPKHPSHLRARIASRSALEWAIREEVRALGRVSLRDGVEVKRLLSDPSSQRVTGVEVESRPGGPNLAELVHKADLVVDASGRGSKGPGWLESLGFGPPEQTVVNAHLGYASRLYRRPQDWSESWQTLYIMNEPPKNPRSGVLTTIEDGRWLVTLVGYNKNYPPTDEEGFEAYAKALAAPTLYHAIRQAEPLSRIHGYRRTENRQRHYERMDRWPGGFLCIGDAVCMLNPVYGQGMTVSAMAAQLLDRYLGRIDGKALDSKQCLMFQKRLARSNSPAFMAATSDDFRWPETQGKPPPGLSYMHRYIDHVFQAALRSELVHTRLIEVLHLTRPPTSLLRPEIVSRVLRVRRQLRREARA